MIGRGAIRDRQIDRHDIAERIADRARQDRSAGGLDDVGDTVDPPVIPIGVALEQIARRKPRVLRREHAAQRSRAHQLLRLDAGQQHPDLPVPARLHEEAFRAFGGSVQYVVLDNLKQGVISPDLYEPQYNPVYTALLSHYNAAADAARVADPDEG